MSGTKSKLKFMPEFSKNISLDIKIIDAMEKISWKIIFIFIVYNLMYSLKNISIDKLYCIKNLNFYTLFIQYKSNKIFIYDLIFYFGWNVL